METHIFADWHNIRLGARGASNDRQYKIDTTKLFKILSRGRENVVSANIYGAGIDKIYFDPNLWNVRSFDPSVTGKEKQVDISIAVDIMKLLYSCPPGYTIILVSGDLDFNPVVQQILNNQIEVELWSFRKALSSTLKDLYRPKIYYLDGYLQDLTLKKYHRIPVRDFLDLEQTPGMA